MHEEIQGLWFCPSPVEPDCLDYFHFGRDDKVVTFTPLRQERVVCNVIAYWCRQDSGDHFQLHVSPRGHWWTFTLSCRMVS